MAAAALAPQRLPASCLAAIRTAIDGVIKHEMPKGNMVNITFNNKKTSVQKIVAALKKGELTVNGKSVLIKK